jgi:hypothetical protein
LERSPKDLAKPYFDRKYESVQTRQNLLGGLAGDPEQWSLNRAQTDVPVTPEAADVTVAVGIKVMDETALDDEEEVRVEDVLVEKKVEVCGV